MSKLIQIALFITLLALVGCSENKNNTNINQLDINKTEVKEEFQAEIKTTVYTEGVDYRVVKDINSGDLSSPFIIEYFWLSCGHCQTLEKPLQAFKSEHPNVGFIRKHAVLGERWVMDARLYYALEETNNTEHFDQFFSLYMEGMSEERLNNFFINNQINKDEFLKVAGSSETILTQMKESLKEMTDNKMTSVPSLVINGKYLILKSADGDYFDLVNYLLTK
jgi:thiol:disulfide interchange protein DsbA